MDLQEDNKRINFWHSCELYRNIAYITGFCQKGLILHEQHDSYLNLTIENNQDPGSEADKE